MRTAVRHASQAPADAFDVDADPMDEHRVRSVAWLLRPAPHREGTQPSLAVGSVFRYRSRQECGESNHLHRRAGPVEP